MLQTFSPFLHRSCCRGQSPAEVHVFRWLICPFCSPCLFTVQMHCVNSWLHVTELPFLCLFWPSKAFETTISFIYTDTYTKFSHAFFLVKADTANIPHQASVSFSKILSCSSVLHHFFLCISKACLQTQPSDLICDHQFLLLQLGLRWQNEWLLTENDAWLDFKMNFLKKETL